MDGMPFPEEILPAVEHVMGTLDHDASRIQGIADRLTQTVGASLDGDKSSLTSLKGKLKRAVSKSIVKKDGANLTDLGQVMRNAAARSIDADEQRHEVLQRKLTAALAPHGVTMEQVQAGFRPGGPAPAQPRPGCHFPPRVPGRPELVPVASAAGSDVYEQHGEAVCLDDRMAVYDPLTRCWSCVGPGPPPVLPPPPSPPPPPPIIPPPIIPPPPVVPPPPPPVVPPPITRVETCPELPGTLPGVFVYLRPWREPGDPTAGIWSDCGRKMVADASGFVVNATALAEAMASGPGWYNRYLAHTLFDASALVAELFGDYSSGSDLISVR